MERNRVVIFGNNYNSLLGLARALGSDGYEVYVLRTSMKKSRVFLRNLGKNPESKSKYVDRYLSLPSNTEEQVVDTLINQCAAEGRKSLLIPVDDRCAEIIDMNYNRLSPCFYLPNVGNRAGGVMQLIDKLYKKQLAKSVGLPVPEGWSVKIENGKYEMPKDVSFPCFIKAEMPMKNRKKYMRKCTNYSELKQGLEKAAAYKDCMMLIEEYVEIEKEFGTVGMSNRSKVCIPGITEKVLVGHGSQAGVTVIGKIHPTAEYEQTYEKLKAMMAKADFHGLFDIDLYESKGVMYFNELNVRIGGAGIGTLLAGVKLPKMLADTFFEEKPDVNYDAKAEEIVFVNERPLISEYGEGFISWRDYKKFENSTKYRFIYDEDDMRPYYNYKAGTVNEMIRRVKRKLSGKKWGSK